MVVTDAAPMPDQKMNAATRTPHQPSIFKPVNWPISVAASTAVVATQSLRLSAAVQA